ncbi:MAG: hypothetical protein H8E44_32745 [Planctomycetes bacterium]|nr:hypothetical protein [Planctomycetota bacterium]MBL7043030.1 hypothetical protein [Pirellulaceae bacterium]
MSKRGEKSRRRNLQFSLRTLLLLMLLLCGLLAWNVDKAKKQHAAVT